MPRQLHVGLWPRRVHNGRPARAIRTQQCIIQRFRRTGISPGACHRARRRRARDPRHRTHVSLSSRRLMRPSFASGSTLDRGGRREDRMRAAPMVACKKQAAVTTGTSRDVRPSLRDGFNSYFALSLVHRAFWPPYPREAKASSRLRQRANALRRTPASGCQDHTTSPYASALFVRRLITRCNTDTSTASRAPRP